MLGKYDKMSNTISNKTSFSLINVNILQTGPLEFPTFDSTKIRVFNLKNVVLLDTIFMGLLRNFISLESLEFSNFQIIRTQHSEPNIRIMLSYVKVINFEFSSWEIFDFLYTPSIANLRLVSHNLRAHPSIILFLSEVNDLKKLELHAVSCDIMEFFKYTNYTFALKQLTLISNSYNGHINTCYDNNFLEFMKEHISSLNTLEMKALLSPVGLEFLMKKMRNLRWLSLKMNYLIYDISLYFSKKPRKSVKHLVLEGPFQSVELIVAILTLFPSAKLLHFRDKHMDFNLNFLADALQRIVTICTDVTDLSLCRMPSFNPGIKFEKLEILRVGYVNDWNDLFSFLNDNMTVHTLYIENIFRGQCEIKIIEVLLKCKILHLHISADPPEIKRIYEFIETIGNGNLISLELTVQSYSESKSYNFHYSPGNTNTLTADDLKFNVHALIINDLVEYLDESEQYVLPRMFNI